MRRIAGAVLLTTAALCAGPPSMAGVVAFAWDPAGAAPPLAGPGSAFTADTIIREEFLRGVGQPDGSFLASRILPSTGFSLNGKAVTPAGFGSSYGLYFDIVDTGVDHLPVSITFKSSDFVLKADPGNHNGAVSATPGGPGFANQGPTGTADDITLASGSLVSETSGLATPIIQTFTPAAGEEGFFVSPTLNGLVLLGSVNTTFGKLIVTPQPDGTTITTINGDGFGVSQFLVPEPGSIGLLAAGLLGLAPLLRRSRR